MLTSDYGPTTQAGNGATVAYNFSFKILAAADLVVSKTDASGTDSGTLVLGTDYTVTFDPIAETGTVTYTVAPVAGGFSVIGRLTGNTQETSLPRESPFPAKTVETMVDKITARVQELEYDVDQFTAAVSPIVVNTDAVLLARAVAAPSVAFLGVLTTTRTVQLYTGNTTLGTGGWVLLGGF